MTKRKAAQRRMIAPDRPIYPRCPDCGYDNWEYGSHKPDPDKPGLAFGYYWDGPRRALTAGMYNHLYAKKGRIYGGRKRHPYGGAQKGAGLPSVRVNERKWKIVRRGIYLHVACANPFHEDRSK